jgi:XTP/dITP diphosphohydrolase
MPHRENEPVVINTITGWNSSPDLPFATTSDDKLREIEAITGRPAVAAEITEVNEIQDTRWLPVAAAKAREAYDLNGQPVIIEETSFDIHDLQGDQGKPYPGALVKDVLGSIDSRVMHVQKATEMAAARGAEAPRATARTVVGAWDGKQFIYHEGLVHGTLVMPRGDFMFGFDDVLVPDGQEILPNFDPTAPLKTFAEMTLQEKNMLSARGRALQKLKEKPIAIGKNIFMTIEPDQLEEAYARPEELQHPQAIAHAFNLDAVHGNTPNREYEAQVFEPYHVTRYRGGVTRVVAREGSNDTGLVTSGLDTQLDEMGRETKLKSEVDGSPVYYQFGPRQRRRAMLARADEYMRYHVDAGEGQDPKAYEIARAMMNGEVQTVEKSNKPSVVVEELLGILKKQEPILVQGTQTPDAEAEYQSALRTLSIATFGEVGYERLCAEGIMSRKINADYGLIFDPRNDGHPGSIFRIGYMPQGSFKDLLVTSALSFTDCGISRNNYMASADNQLALFLDVRKQLEDMKLPEDIFNLCLSKVGIAVGVEDPRQVEEDVARFEAAGCSKIRFYSTCNDERRHTVPERIRQRFPDLQLYYMPIVNFQHARELIHPNIGINEIGVGHGGGENCDSLGAGGAYTGLKLAYELYRDSAFNKVSVGVEGGGAGVIALMPMVDFISKNKQAFGAVIECGGLYVLDKYGKPVQPYHGSASVFTQLYEAAIHPSTAARRISRAGFVRNVEGVSNYARFKRSEPSVVNKLQRLRMYGGLMLADHGVHNINELRAHTREHGFNNIVAVSQMAAYTAAPHAGNHS